MRSVLLARRMA